MKKLIVTADDFGWTKSVNKGIVRAINEGIVTDVAFMVLTDKPELEDALELISKNNFKDIGLHTCLFPWGITTRPHREDFIKLFRDGSDQQIEDIALKELAIFERLIGRKPDFIAPQFNMHGNLRLLKVLSSYCVENNIPMRIPRALITNDEIQDKNYAAEVYLKRLNVKMPDHLFAHILGSSATDIMNDFFKELASVKDGESVEILIHPGYNDIDTFEGSSLNYERTRDLSIAIHQDFKKKVLDLGFELSHFSQL
jgi:predicted glycoside hydrolase/deacetylase ChbG (UPF0249 family)